MLRSKTFAAAISLSLAACSSSVTNPGTGGGGASTSTTSTSGGSGGATTSDGCAGGTRPVDAGPDAPPGSGVTHGDYPPTGNPWFGSPCGDGLFGAPESAIDFTS